MSTTSPTSTPIAPEVRLFLAKVRAELADLDPDEAREITDGLEADLAELVAERGPASLGDPVEYAGELRLAAGLPSSGASATRTGVAERITRILDRSHDFADRQIDRLPGDSAPLLAWLRPTWWLVRAWLALQLSVPIGHRLGVLGAYEYWQASPMPRWHGLEWVGLAICVVLSVQIGRGRLWPGRRPDASRGLAGRATLLGLNVLAVAVIPYGLSALASDYQFQHGYEEGMQEAQATWSSSAEVDGKPYYADQAGIYSDGHWVSQVFPYDAAGKPLVGVQLFDQTGKPIHVVTQPECQVPSGWDESGNPLPSTGEAPAPAAGEGGYCEDQVGTAVQPRVYYPWTNGAAQLYNVFPLTSRYQDEVDLAATAFAEQTPPAVGGLPFATVPPVSLPGVATTQVTPPEAAKTPGAAKGK